MFVNSSILPGTAKSSKDDHTKVDAEAIMENISIVLFTLTVVFGITGNSLVIWVAGFKLKVDAQFMMSAMLSITRLTISNKYKRNFQLENM